MSLLHTFQAKQKLLSGEELDEAFVAQIIVEKLSSPEIKHYGEQDPCMHGATHCGEQDPCMHDAIRDYTLQ